MKKEIIVKGKPLPICYGTRVFQEICEEHGHTLGEMISEANNAEAGLGAASLAIKLAPLALNEGSRKAGNSERYTLDDVTDMIDDEPRLLSELIGLMSEGLVVLTPGFTAGQKSPKNPQTKPRPTRAK